MVIIQCFLCFTSWHNNSRALNYDLWLSKLRLTLPVARICMYYLYVYTLIVPLYAHVEEGIEKPDFVHANREHWTEDVKRVSVAYGMAVKEREEMQDKHMIARPSIQS
jgi:hypothetical protein